MIFQLPMHMCQKSSPKQNYPQWQPNHSKLSKRNSFSRRHGSLFSAVGIVSDVLWKSNTPNDIFANDMYNCCFAHRRDPTTISVSVENIARQLTHLKLIVNARDANGNELDQGVVGKTGPC
mmetsp:Transcript_89454/g.175070  ORF Transcript_89454/g.175070 Transcript_89454/m.175070 type:complete len:121 (-) Transcript_89454:299-661(-)